MTDRFTIPRVLGVAAAVVLLGAYVAGGFYTIDSAQTGVVVRFGKVVHSPASPGLHWEVLWPFATVHRVNTEESYFMSVGYREDDLIRGIPPRPEETEFLTSDINLISFRLRMWYTIVDPEAFLFRTEKPQFLIRKIAESHLTQIVGGMEVDDVLTVGRQAIAEDLRRRTQEGLDRYDVGLILGQVNIRTVEPPPQVKPAFQDVVDARADRNRMINEARTDANQLLPQARGEAEVRIDQARSTKQGRIEQARGAAERVKSLYAQYAQAPNREHFLERLYLQSVQRVIPQTRRVLLDTDEGTAPSTVTIVHEE